MDIGSPTKRGGTGNFPGVGECYRAVQSCEIVLRKTEFSRSNVVRSTVLPEIVSLPDLRLAQIGIRLALSAILLSGVSFQTTYVNTSHPFPALGGPLEFNMTLWASPNPEEDNTPIQLQRLPASSTFFQPFGVLSDYTTVAPFSAPTENCSAAGSKCFSYVFPGTMLRVLLPTSYHEDGSIESGVPIDQAFVNASKESTHFVLANASAYQLEYFPVQQPNIEFNATDCVTLLWFGEDWPGLNLCAKDVDDDVVASEISDWFHAHPRYMVLLRKWQHPLLRQFGYETWTIGFRSSTSCFLSSSQNCILS